MFSIQSQFAVSGKEVIYHAELVEAFIKTCHSELDSESI